jgi:cellulose synthase/poly-beta-1,6-N-acetylglucosamine synthase-like glycosyltransferase
MAEENHNGRRVLKKNRPEGLYLVKPPNPKAHLRSPRLDAGEISIPCPGLRPPSDNYNPYISASLHRHKGGGSNLSSPDLRGPWPTRTTSSLSDHGSIRKGPIRSGTDDGSDSLKRAFSWKKGSLSTTKHWPKSSDATSTSSTTAALPLDFGANLQAPPVYTSAANSTVWGSGVQLPLVRLAEPAPKCRLRRAHQAITMAIYKHIDPKTVIELIDFRELFWPFDWWKYTCLVMVAAGIAGIIVSQYYTHWIDKAMAITRTNMLPVLIIVIGLEPIMTIIILICARVPDMKPSDQIFESLCAKDIEASEKPSELHNSHETALVIPCHNSDREAMKKVLASAYPHFRPQDIFIVDNGRTKYPPDDFRAFIRSCHPDIVYIWSPIGSKNAAQLVGAIAAKNYNYIMTVDDDVSLPPNFHAPVDQITDLVKGVAFPLRAIDADGNCPLFMVTWQDCEYKMSGLTKLAESHICGVLYPHGAGWFCERQTLVDLISNYHSLDFIAEDVNTGLSMQRMKKRIAFDARVVLETEVPTTILGPGLNWWKQRKNSWEMGRHGRLFAFLRALFTSFNGQNTIAGIVAQKTIHTYAIASIIVDWIRIPVLITMSNDLVFWRQALLLSLLSMFPLLAFKYINARRRLDLQPGFWGAVTYPFYKQLYAFVSIFGAMRALCYYMGGHKKPLTVKQMKKAGDWRVFWEDPRFEMNPAWLADEGEAIRAAETSEAKMVE